MSAVQSWWATGFGLVALSLALAFWDPATAGGPVLCLFHRATGIFCPACGMTRAAAALAHGELVTAMRWHPLLVPLAAEAGVLWLAWGVALREGSRLEALRRLAPRLAIANGLLLLVVWLVRLTNGTLPA